MTHNKKSFIATIAIALALLLMATSFAWQQTAHKVNEFIGHKKHIVLHDDFCGNTKDVYVENVGDGEIYIRVKLNETMKLGSNLWRPGLNDWVAHVYRMNANSPVDCGNRNIADNELFHAYFTWEMGGQKWYKPGGTDSSGTLSQDTQDYTGVAGAKLTLPGNIIRWNTYQAMSLAARAAYVGWIYDSDGYAYWSQPLQPDTATGLLLHGVKVSPLLTNKEYYYAIDVIVEAVDYEDIPMWTQGRASVDGSGKTYPIAANPGIINSIKLQANQYNASATRSLLIESAELVIEEEPEEMTTIEEVTTAEEETTTEEITTTEEVTTTEIDEE